MFFEHRAGALSKTPTSRDRSPKTVDDAVVLQVGQVAAGLGSGRGFPGLRDGLRVQRPNGQGHEGRLRKTWGPAAV